MTTNVSAVAASGHTVNANIGASASATGCHHLNASSILSLNQLPNDLVTNKETFMNLFSGCDSVWHHLQDQKRQDLMNKYLPNQLSKSDKLQTIELPNERLFESIQL